MGDTELRCPSCCDQIFSSKSALIEHLTNILNNVICPICQNKWSSLIHLIEHLSLDNCQILHNSAVGLNFNAESEIINHEQIAKDPLLEECNLETSQIQDNAEKDLGSPFSPAIQDNTDGVSEVGRIYEEFLSKQLGQPQIQSHELKFIKEDGTDQYVLVLKEENLQQESENGQVENSTASLNYNAESAIISDEQIAKGPILEECNMESSQLQDNAEKDLSSPVSPEIQEIQDGVAEVGRIYEEFLSKQLGQSQLQSHELKLIKEDGGDQYVLVLKKEDMPSEHDNMDMTETPANPQEQDPGSEEEIYSCNSCGMSFTSVLEHIRNYHNNQDVVVEEQPAEPEPEADTITDNMFDDPVSGQPPNSSSELSLKRMITDTGDIIEAPMALSSSISLGEANGDTAAEPVLKEQVSDSMGRTFTRRWVPADDLKDSDSEKNSKNDADKVRPYHKVVMKDLKKIDGSNIQVYHCIACNTYVKNLNDFKSRPCLKVKYQCQHCAVAYDSPKSLNAHMKAHKNHNVLPRQPPASIHECAICNTVFQSHKSLKLHKRMHDPVKSRLNLPFPMDEKGVAASFACKICNKVIPKECYQLHEESHNMEKEVFHCDLCNKLFQTADHLEMHRSVHALNKVPVVDEKSRPYKCLYCTRSFTRPHEKVKHERIHTGEKPHACEICGKSFRVAFCLTLHMRTHTGARPYECQHCGKRFKAYSVYSHHMLIHSDVRAYKCPFCPKAFKTPVQLAGHKKSHTKPFSCQHCNRPFASLYAVRIHTETHSQQNKLKFSCTLCGASYARAFGLKDHFKSVHKKKDKFDELTKFTPDEAENGSPQITEENISEDRNTIHEVDITEITMNMANNIEVP